MVYNLNQAERERLVERYLSGELNASEEQEFFIQVAVDNNLRQTLKAYRIMDDAMRKDRDSVPPGHSDLRARVMGIWAVRNLGHAHQPATAFGRNPASPETVGSTFGHFMTTLGMTRWIVSVTAVSTIAVGLFVAGAFSTNSTSTGATSRSNASRTLSRAAADTFGATIPIVPAPRTENTVSAPADAGPMAANEAMPEERAAQRVEGHGASHAAAKPTVHLKPEEKLSPTLPAPAVPSVTGPSTPNEATRQSAQPAQASESAHPTLSTSDTIKLRVKMTLPKR